jgi:nicotinate-nucleotide adenylyltransferase
MSELSALSPALMPLVEEGVIRTPVMEISSTEIRARLGKGLFCGHLVPAKVLQHINKNFLYTHEA